MKVYYKDKITSKIYSDPFNQHFRYGSGLFETIFYDGQKVQNLEEHISRILSSTEYFGYKPYSFDYSGIIYQLLTENWLMGLPAKINICHVMEKPDEYYIFIATVPYTAPPEDKVFQLCVYPHVHHSYMSRHKTMNYMHFIAAKKYAEKCGCDDALLIDADGNVLETSTASLVFHDGSSYFVPKSDNRLNSISEAQFAKKQTITRADLKPEDIKDMQIFILNSLMGMRKAEIR